MKNLSVISIVISVIALAGVGFNFAQTAKIQSLSVIQDAMTASQPFSVTFVSDEENFGEKIEAVKANVFKTMNYEIVSSDSLKGKALIQKFEAKYLPLMVTGDAIKKSEIKDYLSQLATEKDGEFSVNISDIASQMKVDISKTFIKLPIVLPHDATKGPEDAKVTFIEISDFECPYCQKFHNEAYKKLIEKYSDRVKFVFKNLPLDFHKNAQKAGEAAQCSLRQGKFWEMHDKLFANQKSLSEANYKKWAAELGMNSAKFDACLDNGETAAEVRSQADQAAAFGIQGTPGVFVNDKFVNGAYPYETFEKLIEAELAK